MSDLARFRRAAAAYCEWVESVTGDPPHGARKVLPLLVELYASGLALPQSPASGEDVEADEVSDAVWKAIYGRLGSLPFNCYGVVLEPHAVPPGEAVVGDVADDLADIYRDIKNGLSLWDHGYEVEAVWHWRFHFGFHWGRHAADAIRVLHVWLEQEAEL